MGPPSVRHVTELPPTGEEGVLYVMDGTGNPVPIPISDVDGLETALGDKADDAAVVHRTGTETVGGSKTFTSPVTVPAATATTHAPRLSQVKSVSHEYYVGSNYDLPHDTHRSILFNSTGVDGGLVTRTTGNTVTGSQFRVNRSGWWRVEAGLEFGWHANNVDERRLYITRGDIQMAVMNTTATVGMMNVGRTFYISTATPIEVKGFQFVNAPLMMVGGMASTWVTLTWVGE